MIWKTERRKIADLNPAKYNPRVMNEKEAEDLKTSLDTFDVVDPIVVNTNNTIIGGHQRVKLLAARGDVEVDVRVPDRELNTDEEMELNLRLNKNRGRFDFDALANFDEGLLNKVGFDAEDIANIFTRPGSPAGGVEKPEVTFTEELKEEHNYIVLRFDNEIDWLQVQSLLGLETVKALDSKEGFEKRGVGRVVDGAKAIEIIRGAA